ncbi:MAG: orotate phosphoribosyltransferase [Bacillota bacterium]
MSDSLDNGHIYSWLDDPKKVFAETGVILEGHFLLTSGKHSNRFMQCSQLLQYPEYVETVGSKMAAPFREQGIETVIGPAMGGVILAYEVARQLGARAIYAEPDGDKMVLKRGFKVDQGERVLVVEDAVSTGGSVQKVIDLLRSLAAEPAGVSVIFDRSSGKVDFGLSTSSVFVMEIESYDPEECPMCKEGIPLEKPKEN